MLQGEKTPETGALPDDYYERIKDRLRRRIARQLRFAAEVLDLGCGSCELDCFLARENGQHVVGVDISDGSFPATHAQGERVECRKADARKLDFLPDGSVDAAVSVYALHEMNDPVDVLREANRVVRSDGDILIVDFPTGSLAQRLWNEGYFTPAEVIRMLKQAGFANVECTLIEKGQLVWALGRKVAAGRDDR